MRLKDSTWPGRGLSPVALKMVVMVELEVVELEEVNCCST
jgi:hypothetical protein